MKNRTGRKAKKLTMSVAVLAASIGYLGYEFRDKPPLKDLLGKILGAPEAKQEMPQTWATFVHGGDNYSLRYPDTYTITRNKEMGIVTFRDQGKPAMVIRVVDDAQRREEALWVTDVPVEAAEIGGRRCKRYVANEREGNLLVQTISFVLAHEGKLLGVGFRSDKDKIDSVQQRILDSFQFEQNFATQPPR